MNKLEQLASDIADNCLILLDETPRIVTKVTSKGPFSLPETPDEVAARLDKAYETEWQRIYNLELERHADCPHVLNETPELAQPRVQRVQFRGLTAHVHLCLNAPMCCNAACGLCRDVDVQMVAQEFDHFNDHTNEAGEVVHQEPVYVDVRLKAEHLLDAIVIGDRRNLRDWMKDEAEEYSLQSNDDAVAALNAQLEDK